MDGEMIRLLTVGEISRRVGCPVHRVDYFIRTRGIKPLEIAGRARVFGDDVLDLLRSELNKGCPADVSPVIVSGADGAQA